MAVLPFNAAGHVEFSDQHMVDGFHRIFSLILVSNLCVRCCPRSKFFREDQTTHPLRQAK